MGGIAMVTEVIISVILLVVGVAVLIVIHVCVVGRAFRGDHGSVPGRLDPTMIPSMDPEEIKNLPCFDYSGNENVECAVCLENLRSGDKCRILQNCNHSFHAECIDSWLLKTAACPVCRSHALSGDHIGIHHLF